MKPLSLALSIEWDDCTVALAGAGIEHGTESTAIELSARTLLDASGGPQASRDALALVQQALRQAGRRLDEVERFYVNVGPGAFTSLRIAVGLVQGLALPGNRPVGAIGSLQALAATVPDWRFPLASPDANEGLSSGRLSSTVSAGAAEGFLGQDGHASADTLPWLLGWASAITPPFCAVPAIGPSPHCRPRSARPMTLPWPSRRCAGS